MGARVGEVGFGEMRSRALVATLMVVLARPRLEAPGAASGGAGEIQRLVSRCDGRGMDKGRTDAGSGGGSAAVERGGVVGVGVAGCDSSLQTGDTGESRVRLGCIFRSYEFLWKSQVHGQIQARGVKESTRGSTSMRQVIRLGYTSDRGASRARREMIRDFELEVSDGE